MILDLTTKEMAMIREMASEARQTERRHGPAFEKLVGRLCDALALEEWKNAGYPERQTPAMLKKLVKGRAAGSSRVR